MAINDVVRHVILRILVDQDGLAEQLAAARAKLKALKDAEGDINRQRGKSADEVTKAFENQSKALGENQRAHEAAQRAAQNGGRAAAEQTKAATDEIKEQTKQVESRTVAEAKAAQLDSQSRQKELDSQRARSAARKKDADDEQSRAIKNAAAEEEARQKRLRSDAARSAARVRGSDVHAAQIVKTEALERSEALKTEALKTDLANRERQRILSEQAARSNANKKAAAEVERLLADAAKINEQANATRSGAANERRIARDQSSAKVARQDYTTIAGEDRKDTNAEARRSRSDANAASDRIRLDTNAAHAREMAELRTTSTVEAARLASEQRVEQSEQVHDERLKTQRQRNEQSLVTQALQDIEKVAEQRRQSAANEETRVEKLRELQRKNAYAEGYRAQTVPDEIAASVAKSQATMEISGAKTDVAQSQAQVAAARALNEEDKANASILERKNALSRNEERFRQDIAKVASQTNLIDQRSAEVAERRARAIEKEASSRKRSGSISGGIEGLVGNAVTAVSTLAFSGPDNTKLDNSVKSLRKVREEGGSAKEAIGAFFKTFGSGEHEAASVLDHITSRVKNFVKELKPATSGGGNLIGNIFGNIGDVANGFMRQIDGAGKHLFSFQSAIVAVIAALGPLAAILGAVGAAALGLASNVVALTGVLAALPGIIGAALAGFGALAIVMKPLTNVFSAYSAAQKEAATTANAATSAALDYKEAVLQQQQALIAYNRAQQDGPRLQNALNDARKQATRDIEDYRTALKKLKFDEEGSQLGVLSAEQQARRAMADPTANNLDRRIALHDVQGAMFDQQDQATQAKRTREDAAEAFKKGVEGSDAVVSAERAVEDQTYKVQEAYIAWQKSIIAVNKAAAEKAAGGTAAAEYQKQIAKLPPETRKVALAIIDLIKSGGPFSKLRDQLSENIFGPLSKDTGKFATVLDELGTFLTPASKAMGILADKVLDLLTNPEWKDFLSRTGDSSATILTNLGDAALSVADGFRGIVTAAQPFTEWVTAAIADVAKQFDSWANSVDADGKSPISKFLDITERRIKELWPVIKNFAAGFAGFFAALNGSGGGEDFTGKFNDGLLIISDSFKKLGDQAADPNSGFRQWLHNVLPLIGQIGHFLGAAGSAFGKLFSDPRNLHEAESLLKNISEKWLPRLAEIFSDLSHSGVISKLASAIGAAFGAIQAFLDHGGLFAISQFASVLGAIGSAIEFLVKHLPLLAGAFGAVAFVAAAAFGAAMIGKIAQFTLKFSGLKFLIDGINTSLGKMGSNIKIPGGTKPGSTGSNGAASTVSNVEELAVLRRMEIYLRQIAINTGGAGNIPDNTVSGDDESGGKKPKNYKPKHVASTAIDEAEEVAEDAAGASGGRGSKGIIRRILGFLGKGVAGDAGSIAVGTIAGGGLLAGAGNTVKKVFGGGSKTSADTGAAATAVEDAAESAGKAGLVKTVGSSVIKGIKGGLPGIIATVAATVGGQYLTDKFVKNDKDKASVNNAIGTVASYAGTGALLGNLIPIPGVGAVAGGLIGGAVGGVKALATDKNLRNFVGGKISSGANAVNGFVSGAASTVKDLAVGKDSGLGGAVALATGPLGLLASKTDIGKMIITSLNKAGATIGRFFTKTIPDFFNAGVKGIETFFTKTLPKLPGLFFDTFFIGIGRMIRFFLHDLPAAAVWLFTKAIPAAATAAWKFVVRDLWNPFLRFIEAIPGFFTQTIPHWFETVDKWREVHIAKPLRNFITKTIPNFFTQTIPRWFEEAPHWFKTHVIDNVTRFFTETLPGFFTKTLPDAVKSLPGALYDHLIQPIIDFFSGLKAHVHISDLFTGAKDLWNWAKGLFERAGRDVKQGEQGKMSGGLITGVFQGIEDTERLRATPGEMVIRRSKTQEPGAKMFLQDFNERGMASLYQGLSANTAPAVMAMVPPEANQLTNRVATVVNHTTNHAPVMGDVTINNPIRERSEATLRRQIHIAAIRHRR